MPNGPEGKNRRKTYFIKKQFQTSFIVKFCILVVIGAVLSGSMVYVMSKSTVTTSFENSRLRIKSTADYILPAVLLSSLMVVVIIGIATVAVTLFTSHRIAGPLYHIEKNVKEIISGNLTVKFPLRKADEIKPLAASLEEMVNSLRENIKSLKDALSQLESTLDTSGNISKTTDSVRILKDTLSKFKT